MHIQDLEILSFSRDVQLALEEMDDLKATFGNQKGNKAVKCSLNSNKVQYWLLRGQKRWSDNDESYDDSQID